MRRARRPPRPARLACLAPPAKTTVQYGRPLATARLQKHYLPRYVFRPKAKIEAGCDELQRAQKRQQPPVPTRSGVNRRHDRGVVALEQHRLASPRGTPDNRAPWAQSADPAMATTKAMQNPATEKRRRQRRRSPNVQTRPIARATKEPMSRPSTPARRRSTTPQTPATTRYPPARPGSAAQNGQAAAPCEPDPVVDARTTGPETRPDSRDASSRRETRAPAWCTST